LIKYNPISVVVFVNSIPSKVIEPMSVSGGSITYYCINCKGFIYWIKTKLVGLNICRMICITKYIVEGCRGS